MRIRIRYKGQEYESNGSYPDYGMRTDMTEKHGTYIILYGRSQIQAVIGHDLNSLDAESFCKSFNLALEKKMEFHDTYLDYEVSIEKPRGRRLIYA